MTLKLISLRNLMRAQGQGGVHPGGARGRGRHGGRHHQLRRGHHPRHRAQTRAVRREHPDRAPHREPLAQLRRPVARRRLLRARGNPRSGSCRDRAHPQQPQHRRRRPDGARGGRGRRAAHPRGRGRLQGGRHPQTLVAGHRGIPGRGRDPARGRSRARPERADGRPPARQRPGPHRHRGCSSPPARRTTSSASRNSPRPSRRSTSPAAYRWPRWPRCARTARSTTWSRQIAEALPGAKVMAIQQVVKSRMEMLAQFTQFSYGISAVILFIGGLVVLVTMMGSVRERTDEIGIFRAIGFRRSHIMRIVFLEAAIVSGAAGVLGYLIGFGGAYSALALAADGDTATPCRCPSARRWRWARSCSRSHWVWRRAPTRPRWPRAWIRTTPCERSDRLLQTGVSVRDPSSGCPLARSFPRPLRVNEPTISAPRLTARHLVFNTLRRQRRLTRVSYILAEGLTKRYGVLDPRQGRHRAAAHRA